MAKASIHISLPDLYKEEIRSSAEAKGISMSELLLTCYEYSKLINVEKKITLKN